MNSGTKLRTLFESALELAATEREAWLDAQALDAESKALLQRMLASEHIGESPFVLPVGDWIDSLDELPPDGQRLVGQRVGEYVLLDWLGQGGSATVFRAERKLVDGVQEVALKLLHYGFYLPQARQRFRRELSILGQLSHPGIARLVDAGISEAGQPFIAMELVRGTNILAYAEHRALDVRQRLALLIQLARAVDAAHRELIVHRDLKPSNVLVEASGRVKVLDFGVAKLLMDDADATATINISLTPGYAPPEQYQGGVVTTSIDVYALGVIASELLLGVRLAPDTVAPEGGPVPASEAQRRWRALDRDLQTILRTALAADPTLRYPFAGLFADDVQRFLNHEPLATAPPSAWYRTRKFVARHRIASVVVGLLGVAVLVALWVALLQAERARASAEAARAELVRANAMQNFMFDAFGDAEPGSGTAPPASVVDAVERALVRVRADYRSDAKARIEILLRLGEVLNAQGQLVRAKEILQETRETADRNLGANDLLSLQATRACAWNAYLRGEYVSSRRDLDQVLQVAKPESSALYVQALYDSALVASKAADSERAVRDAKQAVALAQDSGDGRALRTAQGVYAIVLVDSGDSAAAVPVLKDLLAAGRSEYGEKHAVVAARLAQLARAQRRLGDLADAEASARAAVGIDRDIYKSDDRHLADHLTVLTNILREQRRFPEALEAEQDALRISRVTRGADHPTVAISLNNMGWHLLGLERFGEAAEAFRQALAIDEAKFGSEHVLTANVRASYGYSLAASGRVAEGRHQIDHAIQTLRGAPPTDDDLAIGCQKWAGLELLANDAPGLLVATDCLSGAIIALAKPDPYWAGRVETLRARIAALTARWNEADDTLLKARAALATNPHPNPELLLEQKVLALLVALNLGRIEQATQCAADMDAVLSATRFPPSRLVKEARHLSAQLRALEGKQ